MHVFDPDRAAIGLAQGGDDLPQTGALAAQQPVDKDLAVEVGLGKAVAAVVELGVMAAFVEAERVEIGFEMAADAVRADQLQCADRVRRGPPQRLFVASARRRLDRGAVGLQFRKKAPPALIDGIRLLEKARIKLGYEPGIGAGQERRVVEIYHRVMPQPSLPRERKKGPRASADSLSFRDAPGPCPGAGPEPMNTGDSQAFTGGCSWVPGLRAMPAPRNDKLSKFFASSFAGVTKCRKIRSAFICGQWASTATRR